MESVNQMLNVTEKDIEFHKGYKKGSKETAKEILNEISIVLIALKAGKMLNHKIVNNHISKGGYLVMLDKLNELAKQYGVEVE